MSASRRLPAAPRPIRVVDYDPDWPRVFGELRAVLDGHLGDVALAIEHVGSTSVPGLVAKPIIDLVVVIRSRQDLPQAVSLLAELGYVHTGEGGVPGREQFRNPTDDVARKSSGRSWPRHHLYVCAQDNDNLARQLAFRDHLRTRPDDARRYGELKRHLAIVYEHDREGYSNAKSDFIQGILTKACS